MFWNKSRKNRAGKRKGKGKKEYLCHFSMQYSQSAQTWITQFYLQITPCLAFLRKRSPDGATPKWGSLEEWQDIWNSAANNKLHAIYPTVGKCIHINLAPRRDAVIINRLKIGHSHLTHSYLLSGEDQPTCTKCDTVLTVKHILLDCLELRDVRLKYFAASSLRHFWKCLQSKHHWFY